MTATSLRSEPTSSEEPAVRGPERLFTIKAAAEAIGVKYWLLLHAVNEGTIPSYRLGNTRRRVRISDIEAVLQASRL